MPARKLGEMISQKVFLGGIEIGADTTIVDEPVGKTCRGYGVDDCYYIGPDLDDPHRPRVNLTGFRDGTYTLHLVAPHPTPVAEIEAVLEDALGFVRTLKA